MEALSAEDRALLQKQQEAQRIGYAILELARDTTLSELPFLGRAAARLPVTANDRLPLASDGGMLLFEPWELFTLFRQGQSLVNRAYLHMLLHCLLCHHLVGSKLSRPLWNLACDVAVEHIITDLDRAAFSSPAQARQQGFIDYLQEKGIRLTAEQLYKAFCDSRMPPQQAQELREAFYADDHSLWYQRKQDGDRLWVDLSLEWKELARKTELAMGSEGSEALRQNLHELCRSGRSYRSFLRRFSRTREVLRISTEEYDRNYYCFGMEHYGNIPLIEPLEYSDRLRLRELVIAIDTSRSVSGELVQRFLQHSYDILMGSEAFEGRFHLRILQCDDRIREDVTLHTREEFARYVRDLEIRGLGGTDYRPVFALIRREIDAGALSPDCGLLYFTDGEGICPEEKPGWDTALILFGGAWRSRTLPDWAQKLSLREEDILDGAL